MKIVEREIDAWERVAVNTGAGFKEVRGDLPMAATLLSTDPMLNFIYCDQAYKPVQCKIVKNATARKLVVLKV